MLITGGARGQGRAHALVSAREGADVVVVDACEQFETVPYPMPCTADLEETVRQVEALGRRAVAVQADVRSQEQIDDAVARGISDFGKIDALIANAGIWTMAPFWDITEAQWDETVSVNLSGVWKSAKAIAPHMIERQSGSMVFIASKNGLRPAANYAHYIAAKFGVTGLMNAIALELAPHGIRCNAIYPGTVDTPMINHQGSYDMMAGHPGGGAAAFYDAGYNMNALKGRTWMDPEEIAKTALYLNSDLAANVTGVGIPVEAGGLLLPGFNHSPVKPMT